MFHEEDQGVRGITPELLIEDLARNDAGYVLEVTTDGYGDNALTEGGPDFKKVTMKHEKELLPEFYPYLDGGFQELIKEFLISDESILILGGIPGSGKTVGMCETMISLGLRPLIAQDAQAIRHPAFINTFFSVYDSMFNSEVKEENKQYEVKTDWHFNALKLIQDIMPENKNNNGKVSIEDGRMSIMPSYSMISSRRNASEESEKDATFKIPEIAARKAAGMEDFEEEPTRDIALATALAKPRKKIFIDKNTKRFFAQ